MRKRILSMFLVTTMAVAMLAGCGNKTNQEGTKQTSSATSSATSTEVKSEESVKKEEPVTVKWLIWGNATNDEAIVEEALNEILVETINVKLDLELIPYGEYDQRARLASTSGEDWDIVYTSNWMNRFDENFSRDAFLDVTDLVEQYGQDIIANLQPELWNAAAVKGRYYAIPNQQVAASQPAIFIQKEIADKYGWEKTHIEDWKEMIPLFDAVRDNEEGMTPFHYNTQSLYPGALEGLPGGTSISGDDDPKDGVEVIWKTADLPYSWVSVSGEMYRAGYLHSDVIVGYDVNALQTAGKIAAHIGTASPYQEVNVSNSIGIEYIQVTVGQPYFGRAAGADTMLAINVNSKNPEAAVKVINAMWADEVLYNTLLFGVEGVHYNKVGDRSVEVVEGSEWRQFSYSWALGNSFDRWIMPGEEEDVHELTEAINRTAKASPLQGFTPDTSNLSAELAQISAVNTEYKEIQYSDEWPNNVDEYYKALEAAGIEKVAAEMQRQIDEWLAANK